MRIGRAVSYWSWLPSSNVSETTVAEAAWAVDGRPRVTATAAATPNAAATVRRSRCLDVVLAMEGPLQGAERSPGPDGQGGCVEDEGVWPLGYLAEHHSA